MRTPALDAPARPLTIRVRPRPADLLRAWTLACATGELLGIAAAAALAFGAASLLGEPATLSGRLATLGAFALGGVVEGALVGALQARVLRRVFPALSPGAWVGATAGVAALGWLLGGLPSTFFVPPVAESASSAALQPGAAVALIGGFGLIVGAAFGGAQALVLRRVAGHAWLWTLANALGWGAALGWIYLAASAVPAGVGVVGVLLAGALGGWRPG